MKLAARGPASASFRTGMSRGCWSVIGSGSLADLLRDEKGIPVLGASKWTDTLELDRIAGLRTFAAAGFDYFAIGVPDQAAIEALAARLTGLGEEHAGVHWASLGWILPELHDPDGHEVRFYTTAHHSEPPGEGVLRIDNPRETAEAAERAMHGDRR